MSFLEQKEKSKLTWRTGKLTRGSRSGHHYRWVGKVQGAHYGFNGSHKYFMITTAHHDCGCQPR